MAKKQAKTLRGKPAPVAVQPKLVLIRLQLPAPTHQEFRVEAAREGRSMANMARRLVEDWVSKRRGAK